MTTVCFVLQSVWEVGDYNLFCVEDRVRSGSQQFVSCCRLCGN